MSILYEILERDTVPPSAVRLWHESESVEGSVDSLERECVHLAGKISRRFLPIRTHLKISHFFFQTQIHTVSEVMDDNERLLARERLQIEQIRALDLEDLQVEEVDEDEDEDSSADDERAAP